MKIIKVFICVFLLNCGFSSAQETYHFAAPGLKLGYVFGKDGGLSIGVELSYVYWIDRIVTVAGPVFNFDYFNGTVRIHLGMEVLNLAGVCIGPTMIIKDGKTEYGYSVIPFLGLMIYPYYNYTSVGNHEFDEVGSYFKFPIGLNIKT